MSLIPKIGITIGDINGIGPEVLIKALNLRQINKICIPIIYGSSKHLNKYKNFVKTSHWQYTIIKDPRQANQKNYNIINCLKGPYFDLNLGQRDPLAGQLAFDCLERATADLKAGKLDAIVTAPISKENIQNEQFKFPGHTEYLANAFEKDEVLMFMLSEGLRIGVATGHTAIQNISKELTKELITSKLSLMLNSLKIDFGITKPKIAVLGLNPHAGENGLMGDEENKIIGPVINSFKENGHLIFGPFPSDGFFASGVFKKFDAILAMYHDQGLIPFKMMAFETGVNFTAGLSAIRTSPDHGTGFDIAGKDIADAGSMLHAIYAAIDIAKQRTEYIELEKNSIKHANIDISNL